MNKEAFSIYWELSKPRLSALAVVMTGLGYALARAKTGEGFNFVLFLMTMLGTALVGFASAALNQYMERSQDAMMDRTKGRPLPSGRLSPAKAFGYGILTALLGVLVLLVGVNAITAVLAAFTLLFYLGVYTPAKRVSSLATLIGAVPGAIPPLMGWTAGYGMITLEGLILFGILFLWQVPHFLAIAWMYREDYARGDFAVLPVEDPDGPSTFQQAFLYSLALIAISVLPTVWGFAGATYFFGAIALGVLMLVKVVSLARGRTRKEARSLFLTSIVYLPAIGGLMIWDQLL